LLIIWPFLAIVLVLVLIALASVDILAAGRSYSEGESLWSKGQKTAVFHLIRYAETADEAHYLKYRAAIAVPLGDQIARLEMEKPEFDPAIARAGLLQAKTHPDDVPGVIRLFRIFRKLDYIDRAIRVWTEGDALINALVAEAEVLHATIQSGRTDRESLEPILGRIRDINDKLTPLEDAFTFTLGEATRWSKLVLLGLIVAVAATLIPIGILFSYRMVRNSAAFEDALRASEERFTLAVTGSNDGLWDWNVSAGEVYFSPRFKQLLGYSDAELPNDGTSFLSRLHPDDRERALRKLELHLRSGSLYDDEFRLLTKSGEYRWFHARGQSVRNEAGDPARMAGSISDVTERKLAEVQLFAEKERAQVTLESIADAVITTDTEGCVEYMNPIAESLTGWQSERARGQPLGTVFRTLVESSRETPRDLVEVVLREGRAVQETADIVLARSDGAEIPVTESASPIRDRNGAITGVVVVFHDVSRERQYAAKLTYQATHDALTGLINRREFERRLGLALGAVTDMGRHHAVMYLDLDQFKIVNDTCGHAAGDELMRQASVLLQQRLREGDTLARLGGDEFGVLLENCPPEHARRIADELRQTITDFHFAWHDRSFNIGVSIGLVNLEGYMTLAEVLSAADAACYMAKDKGRNRVQEYRPDDRELSLRQGEMEWVGRIQQAIEEGRLCLHAQEIAPISASAHRRGHFELLLRMVDEHGELVPPMAFIPAAERYNLMSQLDRWVIRTALATPRGARGLRHQPVRRVDRGRALPRLRARAGEGLRRAARQHLLRDHGNRGDREPRQGHAFHPGAQGPRLPLLARRLRRGHVVVRLPEAPARGFPEDRRQLRQGPRRRPSRPCHGGRDQRHRTRDGQEDDRRVRRGHADPRTAEGDRRRLRAGDRRRAGASLHASGTRGRGAPRGARGLNPAGTPGPRTGRPAFIYSTGCALAEFSHVLTSCNHDGDRDHGAGWPRSAQARDAPRSGAARR
jgi:diguanylate cyclase (GGDEF)-like protein/PAS domain S-box-containing protein